MSQLLEPLLYGVRVWARGWSMIGRMIAAYLIVTLWLSPLGGIAAAAGKLNAEWALSPWGLVTTVLVLLIYVPATFYVAASWVGFCKRIDSDDEGKPQA